MIDPMNTGTDSTGVDRKSTRLNSSHLVISYAVFCLKKKVVEIRIKMTLGRVNQRPQDTLSAAHPLAVRAPHGYAVRVVYLRSPVVCLSFFFLSIGDHPGSPSLPQALACRT